MLLFFFENVLIQFLNFNLKNRNNSSLKSSIISDVFSVYVIEIFFLSSS